MARKQPAACVEEGVDLFNKGRFADAVKLFKAALRAGDNDAWTHCFLAHAYTSLGKEKEALRHLEGAFGKKNAPVPVLLVLGEIYEKTGALEEAQRRLERAVTESPRSAEARLKLGGVFLKLEKFEDARKHLREAVRLEKNLAAAHLLLGKALEGGGSPEEAEKEYLRALELDPRAYDACLQLGETCLKRGEFDAAQKRAREAIGLKEKPAGGHLLLGKALEAAGQLKEAAQAYQDTRRLAPRSSEACLLLGQTCMKQGELKEAEKQLKSALRLDAGSVEGRLLLGNVYRAQEKPKAMRDCLRPLLKQRETLDANGTYHRFLAFMSLGEYAAAFDDAESLLDMENADTERRLLYRFWGNDWLRPLSEDRYAEHLNQLEAAARTARTPWARFFTGVLLCHTSRGEQGLSNLDAALKGHDAKRYAWMRCAAGFQRLHLGWYPGAEEDFKAALDSRPEAWWVWCFLAETHLCMGGAEQSQSDMDHAESLAADGNSRGEVWAWRGELLLWSTRYEEAHVCLEKASKIRSSYADCWRGAALMQLGRDKEALAALEAATVPGSVDSEAFIWRGELERRLGRHQESLKSLDRALELDGGSWAYVNRALTRAALEDWDGLWKDFTSIPDGIIEFAQSRLDPIGRSPWNEKEAVRMLDEALRLARGVRRTDRYVNPIWMREV